MVGRDLFANKMNNCCRVWEGPSVDLQGRGLHSGKIVPRDPSPLEDWAKCWGLQTLIRDDLILRGGTSIKAGTIFKY